VNWLDAIRRGGPGAGNAPFSPGVMVAWEVMVGKSHNDIYIYTSRGYIIRPTSRTLATNS
jgi:hypothetical protein